MGSGSEPVESGHRFGYCEPEHGGQQLLSFHAGYHARCLSWFVEMQ